ncbi:trichohyalin-like isoform X3 [Acanthopagrus latus]|uniref:trichohyalin-like isoform X3 n=1 Tax=Acanthopagrus latus TaxID=8177 RepID=UPI00187CD28B|nr:trichohyalin-like isoform X3 [Acanthopagrus latus]
MMSKAPRWHETLVNPKTSKPTAQKSGGKDLAASAAPGSSGGKQAGSTTSKTSIAFGRSSSLSGRGSDSSGSKAGGALKRGSIGQQGTRSRSAGPAARLSSSRSFTSLQGSSLAAAPFMRSSRSLSRLDRRSSGNDPDASSQVNKGLRTEKKALSSGQLSTSQEQNRDNKDRCRGDIKAEKMKTSSPSEPPESSSSMVATAECHHHSSKVQKQTRDGVYTLCAMTSGMRRNWVQAVLKNVRPNTTPDVTSSLPEQTTQQNSRQPDFQLVGGLEKDKHPDIFLQEHKSSDCAEGTHQQQNEEQPEREQSSADGSPALSKMSSSHLSSPMSPSAPAALPPIEGGGGTDASPCNDRAVIESLASATMLSKDERCDEQANMQSEIEKQQTGQLVKELEQTQRELSRLQQVNRNLQDELQQEKESHSWNDLLSNSPSEQALALQRLQKMNHDLRRELEAQKRSQEEARESELRRRVDLLAQQAQLLVTGDATALAQAHLEQDRRRFQELQAEWERRLASLKSQLSISEEQRKDAELRSTQLQQELQNLHSLQQEADRLQKNLQEVTTQLRANEETQAQKEARLQKHLMLLQASQERERRSLTSSLAQAERLSQELQERLDRAEEQVGSLNKTQAWTREIEKAQQQLQEELACTVSAVEKLQEEREQLERRCQELQNQLFEADGEVGRLQSRLKTDETHYYNLEHSYERVCEELQLALGKVQQKESETQDMREGYERQLDRKEQELSEVLLKMEVLGNSLEETEVKLNEMLKVCTCASAREPSQRHQASGLLSSNENSGEPARARSLSTSSSYKSFVAAGDDPERFMSVIQMLETKLYATEEKLRDIMQRLDERQSHLSCQDPHLCSQLTRSRATAQHLSLLLHSQAKQSQRFAQETENCCRMLVGRFQVALNIIQACRERLQTAPINTADFEKQLATVVACLQQGEKDAEKQKQESRNASNGEDKILNDVTLDGAESAQSKLPSEDHMESVGRCLMKELFVLEKMVSVLQSQQCIGLLPLAQKENEGDVARRYKNIVSQRIALKTEKSGADCEGAISRVCAEAELIYAALKCQQQYEGMTQVNNQEVEHRRKGLADVSPPELAPYEEQVQAEGAAKPAAKDGSDVKEVDAEKEPHWSQKLISRLQKRVKCVRQLCQEITNANGVDCSMDDSWENASAADVNWMQEQAKLIYLLERLHLDLEQELQQSEVLRAKLQALYKERDTTFKDEQEAFNHTLYQLQEDNSVLREELEQAEQKMISMETGNQRLLEDIGKIEDHREERMKKLETEYQEKIRELQHIHEEEMKHLHGYYTKEKQPKPCTEVPGFGNRIAGGNAAAMREAYQKDPEKVETPCDEGFSAMEDMHRKLIGDLQQQHDEEVAALLKEKDQLLQEETAATMAAIVAMRRAHKQELERSRQSQQIKESADITQLYVEHEKEIQLLHKELEVLSVQHTQKCLENSQLNQELQRERQSLMQCQQENEELKKKQSEADEMSQRNFSRKGKQSFDAPQADDIYEMEVILRAREAEMQFLRQEARSLREELKIARMDKLYAQNRLEALFTNSQDEPHHDANKLCEDFKFNTWSPSRDTSGQSLDDTVTNTSNAAFLKRTEKSYLTRQIRGVRSKSLKEGLSAQERMKLFESF